VKKILDGMSGTPWLMAMLLYGAGLRLMECCRLRIKDIEFSQNQILIRDGKGGKDRYTMLPVAVRDLLYQHVQRVQRLHEEDLRQGLGRVSLPNALARKYPNAPREWGWQWVFPATSHYVDRMNGEKRRHHLHESVLQKCLRRHASKLKSSNLPAAIPCVIRSQLICSKMVMTFGLYKNYSGTAM
jgi:integrase